jgi:hypothetical protein
MNASTIHPVAPEELMAFLDGELSTSRTQSVSAHIEQCAECTALTAEFHNTAKTLSNWQVGKPSALFEQHVLSTIENTKELTVTRLPWLRGFQLAFSRPLPWAVGCVVFAVLIAVQLTSQRTEFQGWMGHSTPRSVLESAHSSATPLIVHEPGEFASRGAGGGGGSSVDALSYAMNSSSYSAASDGPTTPKYERREGLPSTVKASGSDDSKIGVLRGSREPMIARTVALSLVVKDFDASRKSLDAILARRNGYAATLTVNTEQGAARSLIASLRIPAPQLAAAMNELKSLGRVETESQNGEEVTQQHADLVARLKNSRETEQRLQAILVQRTGKISDVLEVEQEIARVRGEIEQMEAEQKNLEHRVDFATIDLKFADEYKAQLGSPATSVSTQFHNALVNGYTNAADSLLGLLLSLVQYGPVLLLWIVLLSSPAWVLWRRWKRASAAV